MYKFKKHKQENIDNFHKIKKQEQISPIEGRFSDISMSDNGRLRFNVFDRNIGRPINNAILSVFTKESDGTEKMLGSLKSDSSGQTEVLTLDCPPKEYSFIPSAPKPYAEYTVRVEADDFETMEVDGMQILDDTLAIQNIEMNPKKTNESDIRNIIVSPHTLWLPYPPKIPEEKVKPLPPTTGFVVLDNPVVPEYIVVHDGTPDNTSATNYTIRYRDYIKNVASSEIYSTWPRETIIANVLVIISFTLNRVYTEWYRGKGKNFTITSSTAFDQAFFYGRNIFQEISNVVDDIFNTYITKPKIRQPLFTQYCDGVRAKCPDWMRQWESKELGEQGYSYMQILRNFYGTDIYLDSADKIAGVPSSFPGYTLQVGSSGKEVRTIQEQLNSISNNYPAIKKVKVDGVYGDATKDSVITFQSIFNMPQTGMVDFATWYSISNVYVAVTRMAELV